MKAVFFEKFGGVDVLQYGDFPTPQPDVDSVFSLQDAAKVQERMEKGEHVGKIVLEV